MTWLAALVTTLAVEVPLYWLVLAHFCKLERLRSLALAVGVNAVSHPLLWFALLPALGPVVGPPADLLVGEGVVVALEASILVLAVRRERVALLAFAVVANAASLLVGLVLQQ